MATAKKERVSTSQMLHDVAVSVAKFDASAVDAFRLSFEAGGYHTGVCSRCNRTLLSVAFLVTSDDGTGYRVCKECLPDIVFSKPAVAPAPADAHRKVPCTCEDCTKSTASSS